MITMTVATNVSACQDLFMLLTETLYLLRFYCLSYGENQGRNVGVLSCECSQFQWGATERMEYRKRRITGERNSLGKLFLHLYLGFIGCLVLSDLDKMFCTR